MKEIKVFKNMKNKGLNKIENISPKSKYSKNIEKNLMLRASPS